MSDPKISVVMPVFNGEKYLEKSIKSILKQSFKNFELIIINDASTDKTAKILHEIKDLRLKIIENSKNLGVTKSLNRGLKQAKGEFIARCDADDINDLKRFEKQLQFLESNPEYVLVGSNGLLIDKNGEKVGTIEQPKSDREIRKSIIKRNPILHPSVMFRISAIKKVGQYREFFNGAEDYDLWFRLLKLGKFCNLSEYLIKRRVHENAITQKYHLKSEILAIIIRLQNLI